MEPSLNNSFPCYYFNDKYENMEIDSEEKTNISAFNLNFLKIYSNLNINTVTKEDNLCKDLNLNNTCKEFNFSPPKKKNSLDMSYSMEQTFYENSHIINIEEEFQGQGNEETYLKIGNEGQNPCIDPIQEVDSFERDNNESFLHENNYLFDNFIEGGSSFENASSNLPSDLYKLDSTIDESDLCKLRKNILSLKLSKSNINANKSDINIIYGKKPIFYTTTNTSNFIMKDGLNLINQSTSNINNKLNLSCNISDTFSKKRGRKKFLFDGVKTEILDKAFLREFKCYIRKSKSLLKNISDDLKIDEKIFWNEFLQNNNPPFYFTENKNKVEFKSFSKMFLKYVFSHQSVRQLYTIFVKEKEKEIINSIISKKIKKIDRKMLLFYSFYGKNLHKLYSNDYNFNDINTSELESILGGYTSIGTSTSTNGMNVSDSLNYMNSSS